MELVTLNTLFSVGQEGGPFGTPLWHKVLSCEILEGGIDTCVV